MADYEVVGSPTNYGAPNVFSQGQGQQGQQGQGQNSQIAQALQRAKQMLSQGLISADQYNQLSAKFAPSPSAELATSAGNMGATMPGSAGAPGMPMNIVPGA
jgi:hypothetical protein